jgi:hypothetical protein
VAGAAGFLVGERAVFVPLRVRTGFESSGLPRLPACPAMRRRPDRRAGAEVVKSTVPLDRLSNASIALNAEAVSRR